MCCSYLLHTLGIPYIFPVQGHGKPIYSALRTEFETPSLLSKDPLSNILFKLTTCKILKSKAEFLTGNRVIMNVKTLFQNCYTFGIPYIFPVMGTLYTVH